MVNLELRTQSQAYLSWRPRLFHGICFDARIALEYVDSLRWKVLPGAIDLPHVAIEGINNVLGFSAPPSVL